jgi:hypothetical protein
MYFLNVIFFIADLSGGDFSWSGGGTADSPIDMAGG